MRVTLTLVPSEGPNVVAAEAVLVEEVEDRHQFALDCVRAQGSRRDHFLDLVLPRGHVEAAETPEAAF